MTSLTYFLQPSLFFAAAFQFRICSNSTVYLQTATSHLSPGYPSGLLTPKYSPIALFCGHENHPKLLCVQPTAVYVTIWQFGSVILQHI
jgi:hypothetical protein